MAKRIYDILLASVGLVLTSPLLLLLALAVKSSDRGPILFRQQRVGRHGRSFSILKFRTMIPNAEKLGRSITQGGDPRVTPIGRLLRRTKLDELPQLWNVLVGNMSLVGPRPEVPRYVEKYNPQQRQVLSLKPGVTDLATLLYRNEEEILRDTEDVETFYVREVLPHKIRLNLAYAASANLWEDTKIILRTLLPGIRLPVRAERFTAAQNGTTGRIMNQPLYPGDLVRVRSLPEILSTLDKDGALEHLPFMPEMIPFCNREFRVFRRLEKTCVEGYGARLMPNTVILDGIRCSGASHDGCQRNCALLWKEQWLQPKEAETASNDQAPATHSQAEPTLRTKRDSDHYFCQSTELGNATQYLFPITFRRCTAEYRAGNVGWRKAFRFLWIPLVVKVKTKLFGLSSVQPVGPSDRTPVENLNLQPGELVEVKTPAQIALTLDRRGRNRGLEFTPQMLPFCGRRYTVRGRVDHAIIEQTAQMRHLKHTVILDGVVCDGHTILGGCSRDVHHLWREIWLRRVENSQDDARAHTARTQQLPPNPM